MAAFACFTVSLLLVSPQGGAAAERLTPTLSKSDIGSLNNKAKKWIDAEQAWDENPKKRKARDKARDIVQLLEKGKDPRSQQTAQKDEIAKSQVYTYELAVDDFIAKYAIAKKKSRRWKDQKALLMNAGKKLDAATPSPIAELSGDQNGYGQQNYGPGVCEGDPQHTDIEAGQALGCAQIAAFVARQGAHLDADYVRERLVEMVGDDDDRIAAWAAIVREHGSS